MPEKTYRLVAVAKELNVGTATIVDHLKDKGFEIEARPTSKISEEMHQVLLAEFAEDKDVKERADQITLGGQARENVEIDKSAVGVTSKKQDQEEIVIKNVGAAAIETKEEEAPAKREERKVEGPKVVGKIDLDEGKKKEEPVKEEKEEPKEEVKKEEKKEEPKAKEEPPKEKETPKEITKMAVENLEGPKVVGKIDLPPPEEQKKKLVASSSENVSMDKKKKKRKRVFKKDVQSKGRSDQEAQEISEKEIQDKIKQTLSRLEGGKAKGSKAKYKRMKREAAEEAPEELAPGEKATLQVTEFISVNEMASLMDVSVTDVISKCMGLGVIVSMNQRLDAEIIELVTDEFGFEVEFIDLEAKEEIEVAEASDDPETLEERPPIVTIMGHVDHGKTSLLDFIRETNVVAGESGGITQHIGAYEVELESGKQITFLDTPGHEAFTAMRARGAKVTDIAVIIISADDDIMPQTKEAISHAQVASVPMIFAINKMDKEGANPEKIKEQLANMNLLVEDWGGKFQSQDISAKTGLNIDKLLEKIVLEAEILELKANPNKKAVGSIVEASLDKGRGYVCTALVQEGTLEVGDILLAGPYYGKVKAMNNERGLTMKTAGPSTPVQILGLNGAPQAGEKIRVLDSESEARELSTKKEGILREQGFRSQKHITLDEIGRRLVLGTFKELNIVIKGDVDGSVEALTDSLQKLSTEEVQVNVIHKSVGAISESDVLLASASDAIIIGFNVRPSLAARQVAEKENIEIRLYSIIYDAIEEIKSAMEGMLEPKVEEKVVCNVEVQDIFKISRVGTIAGCQVKDGKITRNTKIRLIRDGIVAYEGTLSSLKRFRDDVKEVTSGMECGITIENYNDVKVGDVIEGYEEVKVARKLES
jgi:translation initiation factor IF-2